jgi:subtilisin-like proprotein convertase family protein
MSAHREAEETIKRKLKIMMNKTLLLGALLAAVLPSAQAILYTTGWTNGVNAVSFANSGVVPDNNYSGWSDSRSVTAPAGTLQSVAVNLQLTGGWNGDLFAYLVNSAGGYSVLLNRVGPGAYGYGDAGMNVTLASVDTFGTRLGNIDAYGGGFAPTGVWNPDGAANLGSFTAASGTWSLFIADQSGSGISTVQSWGLQMDIVAVPEVETWVAAALTGAFGAFWLNRQIWRGVAKR